MPDISNNLVYDRSGCSREPNFSLMHYPRGREKSSFQSKHEGGGKNLSKTAGIMTEDERGFKDFFSWLALAFAYQKQKHSTEPV